MKINQPPFPPTDIEAVAITNIGLMFGHLLVLIFMMCFMLFLYLKLSNDIQDFLPILIVYLFSLLIGITSLEHLHSLFSPNMEFFFLIFQTSLFLLTSFKAYSNYQNKRGI